MEMTERPAGAERKRTGEENSREERWGPGGREARDLGNKCAQPMPGRARCGAHLSGADAGEANGPEPGASSEATTPCAEPLRALRKGRISRGVQDSAREPAGACGLETLGWTEGSFTLNTGRTPLASRLRTATSRRGRWQLPKAQDLVGQAQPPLVSRKHSLQNGALHRELPLSTCGRVGKRWT